MFYRIVKIFEVPEYALINSRNQIQCRGTKDFCISMYNKNFERPDSTLKITNL